MAKYYNEAEAAAKLNITPPDLAQLVRDGKLRSFQDGSRKLYKAEEIDAMAAKEGSGDIELAPSDTAGGMSLAAADTAKPRGKEDTVITAEGISIFDDEDLQIEAADPMAKTQIAPSLEDQVSVEGVGSGSGLLDLTRESDDTSLGAEVLDNIDGIGSGVGSSLGGEEAPAAAAAAPAVEAGPVYVEAVDAASGAFNGMIVGTAVVALFMTAVAMASLAGIVPGYVDAFKGTPFLIILVGAVVIGAAAAVGYVVGKGAAARQTAMQRLR